MNLDSTYIADIKKFKTLSKEEEIKLAKRMKTDPIAKEEFINANLKLVLFFASKYTTYGLPLEDLIQEGNMGLMQAVDKFDYTKGYMFSTYATFWIKNYIFKAITREKKQSKGISGRMSMFYDEVISTENQLLAKLGRFPTNKEIADEMGILEEKVVYIKEHGQNTVSIDGFTIDDKELSFDIPDPTNMEEEVINSLGISEFDNIFEQLTEREVEVIRRRMGFDGEPETLTAIAKSMGVSKQRTQQLEANALKKIKKLYTMQKGGTTYE